MPRTITLAIAKTSSQIEKFGVKESISRLHINYEGNQNFLTGIKTHQEHMSDQHMFSLSHKFITYKLEGETTRIRYKSS